MRSPSTFLRLLVLFMVGIIIVGSLMAVSSNYHLFTVGVHAMGISSQVIRSGVSDNGDVKTALLDRVLPNSFSDIAKQASPAVVKIVSKVKVKSNNRSIDGNDWNSDLFFQQFFGKMFGDSGRQQQGQEQSDDLVQNGIGSGFIFEKSGYILTNEHVIDGADEIDVTIQGYDQPFKAKLLGSSYDLDLAELKIKGITDFPTLAIGNSDEDQVGDWVIAIGNPYDFDYTVTAGVLSAKERPISIPDPEGTRNYKHLLQTDAKINPGNSGGPLLNLNGEVIGINTAVSTQARGIGFAIPTSTISQLFMN